MKKKTQQQHHADKKYMYTRKAMCNRNKPKQTVMCTSITRTGKRRQQCNNIRINTITRNKKHKKNMRRQTKKTHIRRKKNTQPENENTTKKNTKKNVNETKKNSMNDSHTKNNVHVYETTHERVAEKKHI